MSDQMTLHVDAKQATFDQVRAVEVPPATETFVPIAHHHLIDQVKLSVEALLPGHTLHRERFGLTSNGQRMFATMAWQNGREDMGFAVGLRNSHDKSMSLLIGLGGQVWVCDNLAFTASRLLKLKHTGNIEERLEREAFFAIHQGKGAFLQLARDADQWNRVEVSDKAAAQVVGELAYKQILTPQHVGQALSLWRKGEYPAQFGFNGMERSAWGLYNCFTETLKKGDARKRMGRHLELHGTFGEHFPVSLN